MGGSEKGQAPGVGMGHGPLTATRPITAGEAALRVADWQAARAAFQAALDRQPEDAEALAGLGLACWWLNALDDALDLRERAYGAFRRSGDVRGAARMAMWLARQHALIRGNSAAFSGWMARADRLLRETEPCAEQGWLTLFRGCSSSDPSVVDRAATDAMDVARRFSDTDLDLLALAYSGLARVAAGAIAEGMLRLDEAMAAATGGELSSYEVLGEIYCTLLAACDRAADPARAEQWRRMMDDFVRRHHQTAFGATCRALYGAVLTATGRWPEAEQELIAALRSFEEGSRAMQVDAAARLADLRIRQGRLDEARRLLEPWLEHPEAAASLAALHLAQGEPELATAALQRRLTDLGPTETLQATPLLAMLAESLAAQGNAAATGEVAARLARMADVSGSPAVGAAAAMAAGRLARLEGSDAVPPLERALAGFARVGLPFEAARARLALAEALRARDARLAAAEAATARAIFDRLGAVAAARAAALLARHLGTVGRPGPQLSAREEEVLELLAEGLSNQQIAAQLCISRRTAEHHVSSILGKLGHASRAEAAAYAAARQAAAARVAPITQWVGG